MNLKYTNYIIFFVLLAIPGFLHAGKIDEIAESLLTEIDAKEALAGKRIFLTYENVIYVEEKTLTTPFSRLLVDSVETVLRSKFDSVVLNQPDLNDRLCMKAFYRKDENGWEVQLHLLKIPLDWFSDPIMLAASSVVIHDENLEKKCFTINTRTIAQSLIRGLVENCSTIVDRRSVRLLDFKPDSLDSFPTLNRKLLSDIRNEFLGDYLFEISDSEHCRYIIQPEYSIEEDHMVRLSLELQDHHSRSLYGSELYLDISDSDEQEIYLDSDLDSIFDVDYTCSVVVNKRNEHAEVSESSLLLLKELFENELSSYGIRIHSSKLGKGSRGVNLIELQINEPRGSTQTSGMGLQKVRCGVNIWSQGNNGKLIFQKNYSAQSHVNFAKIEPGEYSHLVLSILSKDIVNDIKDELNNNLIFNNK